MSFKYLVGYFVSGTPGLYPDQHGRAFFTTEGPVTESNIEEMERQLKDQRGAGCHSVVIQSVSEVAA